MSFPSDSQGEPESRKLRADSSRKRSLHFILVVPLLFCSAIGVGIRTSHASDVHAQSVAPSAVCVEVDAKRGHPTLEPADEIADKIADTGREGALAQRVRSELDASGALDLEQVQVNTSDGVVTLVGYVRSQAEKLLAEQLVRDIDGVEAVTNELDVISIPFRASVSTSELAQRSLVHVVAEAGGLW